MTFFDDHDLQSLPALRVRLAWPHLPKATTQRPDMTSTSLCSFMAVAEDTAIDAGGSAQ